MKTIWTTGPKCGCGYGMNRAVTLPEQADIDAQVSQMSATMVARLGRPLTDFETALVVAQVVASTPNGNLIWSQEREDGFRRDHLRQATFVLSCHANEDGSCPGRVGEVPGVDDHKRANARAWNFAKRLRHAEKVLLNHAGKVRGDEPSMTIEELRSYLAKEV